MKFSALSFIYKYVKTFQAFFDNVKRKREAVELVGSNWLEGSDLPIAILYGFNPWKREIISAYLPEYRTAFVQGKSSFSRVKKNFINHLSDDEEFVFIGWGKKLPKSFVFYASYLNKYKGKSVKCGSIEDGFLRSIGAGLLHTRPSSICIDWQGIYFDATQASDLESILNEYDFSSNTELLNRAERCMELMRDARLTKYYNPRPYEAKGKLERTGNYSILVIGQVEDDASVLSGMSKIKDNVSLVLQARKDFPDADIYFRPHPDYWSGIRKQKTKLDKLKDVCAIVSPEISLYELFDVSDHVYTITSLSGFEALIHGLKVTTFGAPFYSNWGLTDDRVKVKRRKRNLLLTELFAASYLLYPRYISIYSDTFVSYEYTAGEFLVEALKHENTFNLQNNTLFKKAEEYKTHLGSSYRILSYLVETGNFAEGDVSNIHELVVKHSSVEELLKFYPQISYLLIRTSNYDSLVYYTNICLAGLSKESSVHTKNFSLISSFFYALSVSLYQTNGRSLDIIPDISSQLLKEASYFKGSQSLLRDYLKCLSANLQYQDSERLICLTQKKLSEKESVTKYIPHYTFDDYVSGFFRVKFNHNVYKHFSHILAQKPSRSERDANTRHALLTKAAGNYEKFLHEKFSGSDDAWLNKVIFHMVQSDHVQARREFLKFSKTTSWKRLVEQAEQKDRFSHLRKKDILAIGNFFLKKRLLDVARLFSPLFKVEGGVVGALYMLSLYRHGQDDVSFIDFYHNLEENVKNDEKIMALYARQMRERGFFETSKEIYQTLARRPATLSKKVSVELDAEKIKFCQESSDILNSIPQPRLPKGVIFLTSQTCFNTLAMMIPSLLQLKKKGYAVVNLCSGMTVHQSTGIDYIDEFAGSIPLDLSYSERKNDWYIDWEQKTVSAKGINFYQGFYERLSTSCRRFFVDINVPSVYSDFENYLIRSDTCLWLCEKIFDNVVKKGIPVAFVSGNSHVAPFSVFRDYARFKDHPKLSFINCNVAYEAYFSNLGSKFANTMCVTDMTLYPNVRAPFMAREDKFNSWYEKNKCNIDYVDYANSLINVNRVGSTSDIKEKKLIEFLEKKKGEGKRIICAFGKVPVDLNVPYDGGAAHADMSDWITHTVATASMSDDIILLVKPHPHELRPEIALDLVESFEDLIKCVVPKNTIVLGHKDINGHALAPFLDLALLYNGSSALELCAQGVPVMMASYFGKHDYPIELNYPQSREDYERFVLSSDYPKPSSELRKRAAFLMSYLGTDEISIVNQYSLRQLTNDRVGIPKWRWDKVEEFLTNGDEKMKLVADRIVEKFENCN